MLYPYYDSSLEMLYLSGKGDGNVRYYEFGNGKLSYLSEFRGGGSGKAYGYFPKNSVDTGLCELVRMMKVSES